MRAKKGWSATELGDQLAAVGVPWNRSVVANFENGRRPLVSVTEWLALARVLDVAPLHLLVEPEGPGAPMGTFQVTPTEAARADDVRSWIRGFAAMPDTDSGRFFSEVPAVEFGYRADGSARGRWLRGVVRYLSRSAGRLSRGEDGRELYELELPAGEAEPSSG
ncbi:helix-turn-helix domain-containing protein [Streptomyces virginiae]|uniref:helix-turn-helix domain-containing protein n=1 Tax=Streptomyces virginiae TaxID=1961 RepID=UPI003245330D